MKVPVFGFPRCDTDNETTLNQTHMQVRLAIILVFFWFGSFGQIKDFSNEIPDCARMTTLTINKLSNDFKENQLDSFEIIANDWIKICGISEFTQRLIVLKNIIDKAPSLASIQTYFENDFQYVLRNRIVDSKRINYGYLYSDNKAYYGYVPLRHKIDSLVMEEAMNLLRTDSLKPDEKLMCILFSGDIEGFDTEIKKSEYNDSYIKQFLNDKYRDYSNHWMGIAVYTGFFKPISSKDVFSYSPVIGFTFSSPLRNKLVVELGFKMRININDDHFNYYAMGDTNYVNSETTLFLGALVGYKIYESKKLILMPKFGIGLESVSTGLSEDKKNSEEKKYHDIETINLSLGLSAMTPVFRKSYIGIGINYHFCPYQADKKLLTKFDNNLISTELFWRF
ncbi:MAG: hypothetical protein CVT94_09170 [Bacteroidetes bacterium HGW-Bacteroidetes-11]|jgi:hypothetical protein|nr:MAG: hypothetical protein CVT94_09170 [Bacteroidetes bacterium HGW-Bacteroidetes-11]